MTLPRYRGLVRTVAPAAEPLTLLEVRDFLRIAHDDDDARISDLIITARSLAEQWLRRSLLTQTWKLIFEDYMADRIALPMGPVQSVTSVQTRTLAGDITAINASSYALSAASDALISASTLYADRIEVVYVCGYGSASQLPKPLKMGLLEHVAAMYDGNMQLAPIPEHVLHYYMPFRELSL